MAKTIEEYTKDAVMIQDACNPAGVSKTLWDVICAARHAGIDPRTTPAVLAIFFKLYDMMGAPSEAEMYQALKTCEASL